MESGLDIATMGENGVEGVRGQLRMTQPALTRAFIGQARVVTSLIQNCDI